MRSILLLSVFPLLLFADASDLLYDDSEIAVIQVQVAPEDLEWIYENIDSDSLHEATVHFKNARIDETIEQVGFRIRGNTSRQSAKKSFKLSFNTFVPGREFYGVDKMNLNGEHNDPSIIRSKLCWDIYQQIGMAASRAAHCAVYINDEYYGLYISIEHIDDEFLNKHFEDDSGNLWKCLWPADLNYQGSGRQEDYHPSSGDDRPYELMTNEDIYDYSKLANLIDVINNTATSEFPEAIEKVLHVPDFLSYIAINNLTGSWDDYWFLRNNYYLYHDPSADKFRWIPFDYDNSFGIDWFGIDWTSVDPYHFPMNDGDGRPLIEKILQVPQYRNLYTHMLGFYSDRVTRLVKVEARIDSLKTMITPWAELDSFRTLDYGFSIPDFHQSYSVSNWSNQHVRRGLKEFINLRNNLLPSQLDYEPASPLIYALDHWPATPTTDDSIHLDVSIHSVAQLNQVIVEAVYGSETTPTEIPMTFDPVNNTTVIQEAHRWTVTLPPVGLRGQVRFQVIAEDVNGRLMRYPRQEPVAPTILGSSELALVINELMTKNDQGPVDPAGEHDDWVEIYNTGDINLDLAGMYLSDKADNLVKWQFPDSGATIGPQEFLLVWCDEDGDQNQPGLHANFKLSADGEAIIFTEADGTTVIDHVEFGPLVADQSYGREQDGGADWVLFDDATPGYSNTLTSIDPEVTLPEELSLSAFPNPFNGQTRLRFQLPETGQARIDLISLRGEFLGTIIDEYREEGPVELVWKAQDAQGNSLSSGVYILHLISGKIVGAQKVTLIK
ncbi:MAG: CotH kinase family protein [Candidatus Marinimicrobia bacterium]|nr:CotH kinase family protein [Candidatus Neomarinimicrobiota bacterium]MCF7850221.1 CotH kinase family protein [Candidatus Neomarinimicrobiota bacterium]MCF7903737.1 CotH kinase family protein [Candidatus Neomarinimicrobiota bacterium]